MRPARKLDAWTVLVGLLLTFATGCNRAGGTPQTAPPAIATTSDDSRRANNHELRSLDELVAQLELERKRGQFEAFVDRALEAADTTAASGDSDSLAAMLLQKTEALAAVGRNAEAEDSALDAAELALAASDFVVADQALKLWTMARFRQPKPLEEARFAASLAKLPPRDAGAQVLRFWRQSLGSRTPYRLDNRTDQHRVEIETADCEAGSVGDELNAIQARANGVALPLVFIDTGSQHNLMTVEAARAAGVKVGASATHLVGFAGHNARPGIVEVLELGGLTLYDVPVLVGDSAPLSALEGQMALGIELMHHVRFTMDYPARRVFAESALARRDLPSEQGLWEIPLWTFSQACLAQGRLATGTHGRVMVDTGNRAGTFVSTRWARHNVPRFNRPASRMVFKFKPRDLAIDFVELGSQALRDWSVLDTIPAALERLDLVDVLVGRDLLGRYQLTIDLPGRVLQLRGEPSPPALTDRRSGMLRDAITDESHEN